MYYNRLLYFLLGLMLVNLSSFAQSKDSADVASPKSIFLGVGFQYISNLTYAGRSDIESVPILLPTLTLVKKNGFFLGAAGYLNAINERFSPDGLSITPGYVFSLGKNKKAGGVVSVTKYFFKDSSQIILGSFNATTDFQFYYTLSFAKISISTIYQFGKMSNDLINSLDISKEISLTKGKNLTISPIFSLMAGTQSFSETYYINGSRQRRIITNPPSNNNPIGGIFPGGGGTGQPQETIVNEPYTTEMQKEVKKYNALSLSLSVPLVYKRDKFQVNLTPYLIKPFNAVDSDAANLFLFTTGFSYIF